MSKLYKILIFDLDDTIIDNKSNVRYAFQKMIKAQNLEITEKDFEKWYEIDKQFWQDWQDGLIKLPEQFKNETGKKSMDFLDWLRSQRVLIYFNYDISQERAIELNNIFMKSLTEMVKPVDGINETLDYLAKKYYIIVATNGPTIAAEEKLNKIDCLKYVKKVLAADMFGYMKPKKEYYAAIQKLLNNYNNNDYLIIGDSLKSDVGFAMNCGFSSCWFDRGEAVFTKGYKPTYIIKKLLELKKIL